MKDSREIIIFDTTLRDGEQAPGCSMTIGEKLKIAQRNIAMLLDNEDDDRVLSGIFSNFCIGK